MRIDCPYKTSDYPMSPSSLWVGPIQSHHDLAARQINLQVTASRGALAVVMHAAKMPFSRASLSYATGAKRLMQSDPCKAPHRKEITESGSGGCKSLFNRRRWNGQVSDGKVMTACHGATTIFSWASSQDARPPRYQKTLGKPISIARRAAL